MRRIIVTLVSFAFLQLIPTPAHAWWEFIEELSGAGPFYGWDIQVRLFCVMEADGKGIVRSPAPIGAIVSACPVKKGEARRLAIDLGARFLWADDNPRFANGERISLTTLEPSISINLFSKHPEWDFLDYGFGVGAYWFTSTEFPSINGAFLEPVRLEFHPTTKMKTDHPWSAAIPALRLALLTWPAGFDNAAFAAAPGEVPRISRDWTLNASISFDLEGLFK